MGHYFSTSLNVDVDIDNTVLEENGFHHEDDCVEREEKQEMDTNQGALRDWHDLKHGLYLWSACQEEPCRLLTYRFRSGYETNR